MDARALRDGYDRSAADYDLRFRSLQVEKYRAMLGDDARVVRESLGVVPRALDLGGGTGLLAEFAAGLGAVPAWVVADFSRGMLVGARRRGLRVVQADAAALPLAPASFGFVAGFTVVGLRPVATAAILAEIARVLAPGGRFVLTVLERDRDPALPRRLEEAGLALECERACGQDRGYSGRR